MNDRTLPRDFVEQLGSRPEARTVDVNDPEVLRAYIADPSTPEDLRRNFESKLDALEHDRDRRARREAMTAEQIVDSIPRNGYR